MTSCSRLGLLQESERGASNSSLGRVETLDFQSVFPERVRWTVLDAIVVPRRGLEPPQCCHR
jgi:hypothetical protein